MKTLYHLTWDFLVPSIMKTGLVPNHTPNKWVMTAAEKRSKNGLYLCSKERAAYWRMTYLDGWVRKPKPGAKLVCLKVLVPRMWIRADRAKGENYGGDFVCSRVVPPQNISVTRL